MSNWDDPLIEPIVDAFGKIEADDLRVERVVLERKVYHDLVTNTRNAGHDLLVTVPRIGMENSDIKGTLWGAKVEVGNESKVYAEKGLLPLSFFNDDRTYDVNYQRSEDILFKEFKYRIRGLKDITILVKSRADIIKNVPKNEMVAIETLREMITEMEFRKYMVHGFILVQSQSGKTYQIFRNHEHTKVWYKGQLIEEICVRIADCKIPPTDNLVAFKTMIETDEEDFRKLGNIYSMKEVA